MWRYMERLKIRPYIEVLGHSKDEYKGVTWKTSLRDEFLVVTAMYPLFWWLAVHKSVVMATRFWNFAKYFTMLSLCTTCMSKISFLIVFLDTTLNIGCRREQNFRKRVWSTIDKGYSCTHIISASSFLANAWSKQHSLDVHFHWHLSTGSISVVLGQ